VFKGTEIAGREPHEIAQMGMALVPQGRRIFSSLTVRENLILGWRKGCKEGLNQALERIFTWFPNLKNRAKSRGGSLSGGEQQMLAIGRAMISNPEFLLMDEPSEGLAPAIIEYLIEKIDEMKASGLSILLVEQNLRAALRLADHLYIMNKGRTTDIGKAGMSLTEEEVKEYFLLDTL
ncbi:MAG: ATP-binding cassette domain-containing protein, partial [Firmicutes bacterium]|nr:ATP-binding cassette domain-containing protein [Bacillota bacterium]